MERRALLRASDADREQVADRLRTAATEGRLSEEELEERVSSAYASRTYGELDTLVDDLPAPATLPDRPRPRRRLPRAARPALALAVLAALLTGALHAGHQGAAAHPNPAVRTTAPPLSPFEIGHHLAAVAFDTIGVIVLLVVAALVAWNVVRRLGHHIS